MVAPFDPGRYQVFAPIPALGPNVDLWFNFRVGCNCVPPGCIAANDTANLTAFQAATGFDGTQSTLLMLVDRNGNWSYVQIPTAGYQTDGSCDDVATFKNIHVTVDTASATLPAPPNGVSAGSLTDPVYLVTGLQVISFRVLTDDVDGIPKLQQKLGLFDPATDNPGVAFTNVMENVEDLQVAYMYAQDVPGATGDNPLVWNTSSQTIGGGSRSPPGGPQRRSDASRHHERDRGAGLRHGAFAAPSARGPEADEQQPGRPRGKPARRPRTSISARPRRITPSRWWASSRVRSLRPLPRDRDPHAPQPDSEGMMRARGSALVSVILVLLVLTIVGVGIAYFTSMEDRLSGNTRITKAGFYAADAGLRRGEALLNEVINLDPTTCGAQNLSLVLAARNSLGHPVLKVPGGGYDAQVLRPFDGLQRPLPRGGPPGLLQHPDPAARGGVRRGRGHLLPLPPQQRG